MKRQGVRYSLLSRNLFILLSASDLLGGIRFRRSLVYAAAVMAA